MQAMDQLPGLGKQEKEALNTYLFLLHRFYSRNLDQQPQEPHTNFTHLNEFLE